MGIKMWTSKIQRESFYVVCDFGDVPDPCIQSDICRISKWSEPSGSVFQFPCQSCASLVDLLKHNHGCDSNEHAHANYALVLHLDFHFSHLVVGTKTKLI